MIQRTFSGLGAVLCAGLGVLTAAVVLWLLSFADRPIPDDAIEGAVVGEAAEVPLTGPAVWAQVHVRRHLINNDDSGSNTLLWMDQVGATVTLQHGDEQIMLDPGDPLHAWRLHARVGARYDTFAELPEAVRAGRDPVPAADGFSVRVYAIHPGDVLLIERDGDRAERIYFGGRAAVEADRRRKATYRPVVAAVAALASLASWLGAVGFGVFACRSRR